MEQEQESRPELIARVFADLKSAGVQALNPDQTVAAFEGLCDAFAFMRTKGFSGKDIDLLTAQARKASVSE